MDIGGGGGIFANEIKKNFPFIDVTVVDPSIQLLNKIVDTNINKILGKLPNQLNVDSIFDYIHLGNVMHHIVGKTPNESKIMIHKSLMTIYNLLKKRWFFLVTEIMYQSHFIPTLTRNFLFYILKMQHFLRIKIPLKYFIMDLEVCFYTKKEFFNMFKKTGYCLIDYKTIPYKKNFLKNLQLLKYWGHIFIILHRSGA